MATTPRNGDTPSSSTPSTTAGGSTPSTNTTSTTVPTDGTTTDPRTAANTAAENGTVVEQSPATGTASAPTLSVGDLPWAIVLQPTTSAGQAGIGNNRHGLQPETWVVGFFADGKNCQQPIIMGVVPGGPGDGSSGAVASAATPGTGTGGTTTPGSGSETPSNTPTGPNVERAWKYLTTSGGYTPVQASGIIGNLMVESGPSLSSSATNPKSGAYGLGQWLGSRKAALLSRPNHATLEGQLAFLDYELKQRPGDSGNAWKLLQNAKTPEDAAVAFCNFERGEDFNPASFRRTGNGCDLSQRPDLTKKRKQFAVQVFNQMSGKAVS